LLPWTLKLPRRCFCSEHCTLRSLLGLVETLEWHRKKHTMHDWILQQGSIFGLQNVVGNRTHARLTAPVVS
jgi:hypothetical protein